METKLQQEINEVLKTLPEYWNENTLLKNKLIEDIRSYNGKIIEALLSNNLIKDTYALQLPSGLIFKTEYFISMLRFKNYWENSYTKYTNEIGLTSEGKYLSYNTDVVLDFPHKDSVLEGGMTREESGKKEIYYHNVLAKEEIDIMESPKILMNARKYNEDGNHNVNEFYNGDNLIIKGNNLISLHTLKKRYAGKIKLIYIDPPFNTKKDSFKYNDKFTRSTWLTFMKNRLEAAKDLLSDDGSIFVHIDTNQSHYLKILMDEIFGEENFKNEIIWHYQSGGRPDTFFAKKHDTIFWYTKTDTYTFNKDDIGVERGNEKRNNMKRNEDEDGRVYFSIKSNGKIYKYYEDEKVTPDDVWKISHLQQQDPERTGFDTQKPEKLVERIIKACSNKDDIILDFFMGSATTLAVSHKLDRQYIGIEQMDYIKTISIPRLEKVIKGEQSGISKEENWQGGGSFIYAEIYDLNNKYIEDIQETLDDKELDSLLEKILKNAYLNFKVDFEKIRRKSENYYSLTLEQKKSILIEALDMNQLYLNYSEIEDSQHEISDSVKSFNHSFYKKEGDQDE